MKISYFLLLSVCASSVYAAPPSLEGTYDPYAYAVPASSTQILDSLNRLQSDVLQLKSKVTDQSRAITDLRIRQDRLEGVRTSLLSSGQKYTNLAPLSSHDPSRVLPGEKNRYEYAYSIFRNGGYDQSIAEFQSIVKTYPNGEYADNAEYWTGEALLKKGDKASAMRAFDRVVRNYPRGAKVPDALLKLGITQASIGNKTKAREYYDYLIAAYPGTPSGQAAYTKRAALY